MHELSVVEQIVNTACSFLDNKDIANAKRMTLIIGDSTGILPEYVRMYYSDLSEGSKLESSELVIEEVETEYFCKDCGHVFKPERTDHHLTENPSCPECHSDDLEMIAGNELMIKDISYE